MEKNTAQRGSSSPSHPRTIPHLRGAGGHPCSSDWKRLQDWHRLIRNELCTTKTPMDFITSGFSLRYIQDLNLSFSEMVEIGLFLNEIYYIVDPSRENYQRKCIPEVHEKDIGNYLSFMMGLLHDLSNEKLDINIDMNEKKGRWQSLDCQIHSYRTIPDMDGYVITYIGRILTEDSKSPHGIKEVKDERLRPCVEAIIIANEVISWQLSFNTDLSAKDMFEENYGFSQNDILSIVELLKQELLEDVDYEELIDKISDTECADGFLYEHIRFMLQSVSLSPKDILEEYHRDKHFHLWKEGLIMETSARIGKNGKVDIEIIRHAEQKINEAMRSIPYRKGSRERKNIETLLRGMKRTMRTAYREIPEFPSINMESCCLASQTTASEIYSEFHRNFYVMLDMMWVDLVGLTSFEDRMMQCGVEIPTNISISSQSIMKQRRRDVIVQQHENKEMIKLLDYLELVSKVREPYFNMIFKLTNDK